MKHGRATNLRDVVLAFGENYRLCLEQCTQDADHGALIAEAAFLVTYARLTKEKDAAAAHP